MRNMIFSVLANLRTIQHDEKSSGSTVNGRLHLTD